MRPYIKKSFHLGILACFQMMLICGVGSVRGEGTQETDKFIIAVKGIRSAADAYKIKLALSQLEGIEKVRFLIEGERFRGCCTVSEEYNNYLKSLESVPMAVFAKGVPVEHILDFLKGSFREQTFELQGQ